MMSYADVLRPARKSLAYTYDLLAIFAGAMFLALISQFSIKLWFTPVPLSMQTFAVLMLGALLGSKRGSLAVVAYIAGGACGLPFFVGGASCVGYLLGFILSTFLVGSLLERGWRESYTKTVMALVLGSVVILGGGALWLASFVGISKALTLGVYPFLIGDALKMALAAALIPTGWKLLK